MQKSSLVVIILITVLAISNIFFIFQFTFTKMELNTTKQQLLVQQTNQKSLSFAKLFVDKFLLGQGPVGFEDRLSLENAVRSIEDPEIFRQWQVFTNSTNDLDAQRNAGILFNLLLNKLSG